MNTDLLSKKCEPCKGNSSKLTQDEILNNAICNLDKNKTIVLCRILENKPISLLVCIKVFFALINNGIENIKNHKLTKNEIALTFS